MKGKHVLYNYPHVIWLEHEECQQVVIPTSWSIAQTGEKNHSDSTILVDGQGNLRDK